MTQRRPPAASATRILAELAGSASPTGPVADEVARWLASSGSFRRFARDNAPKIRKKLATARSEEATADVLAELRVAALLLRDDRFDLVFEAYGAGVRGPDYTARFRAGTTFNIEVTRRRGGGGLERMIATKLRQLPPSVPNVLVVVTTGDATPPDPGDVMRALRAHADRREDAVFHSLGLPGATAFHTGVLRLAAVVCTGARPPGAAAGGHPVAAWRNHGARIALPEPAFRALVKALDGESPAARTITG